MVKYQSVVRFGQKQTVSSRLFSRNLKTTGAGCVPGRKGSWNASLLELQDVASLDSEMSGSIDQIAVVSGVCALIAGSAENLQIVAIDYHARVVPRPLLRWANRNHSGKAPVNHVS